VDNRVFGRPVGGSCDTRMCVRGRVGCGSHRGDGWGDAGWVHGDRAAIGGGGAVVCAPLGRPSDAISTTPCPGRLRRRMPRAGCIAALIIW